RAHRRALRDASAVGDVRRRVDSRRDSGLRKEHREDRGDGGVGLGDADRRPPAEVHSGRRDEGRRPAQPGSGQVPGGGDAREVAGPRALEAREPPDLERRIPLEFPADQAGQLAEGPRGHRYGFFAFSWSYSLMTSSVTSLSGSP